MVETSPYVPISSGSPNIIIIIISIQFLARQQVCVNFFVNLEAQLIISAWPGEFAQPQQS